jgi:hypothetical protein
MKRMEDRNMDQPNGAPLDELFVQYRSACPDVEGGPNFMPQLWQRIEARRNAMTFWLRRWAEVCVLATIGVSVLITTFLIPRYQRDPVYQATYVDVLSAADSNEDLQILPGGDLK